jgi:hypothetical protein
MAKGFGKPPANSPIGYILVLVPGEDIYAGSDPEADNDKYLCITNKLDMAKVWRKQKEVKNELGSYIQWLDEEYYEGCENYLDIEIRALYKGKDEKLTTKIVRSLVLEKQER